MSDLRGKDFFRAAFPYCFDKMESNAFPHVWLPLNRDYKPLGVGVLNRYKWVDYQDHIASALVFSRDPCTFKDVWHSIDPAACYLYDDGTDLDAIYFQRLQRLLGHAHRYYGDTKEPTKGVFEDGKMKWTPRIARWNRPPTEPVISATPFKWIDPKDIPLRTKAERELKKNRPQDQ